MRAGRQWVAALLAATLVLSFAGGAQAAGDAPERRLEGFAVRRGGEPVVEELHPERLFTPASSLKLVLAAALLHHLGPDFRIVTRLRSEAPPRDGVVAGDLFVEAAADPSWGGRLYAGGADEPLDRLAAALVSAGVRQVEGDLVVLGGEFPGPRHGESVSPVDRSLWYGAPTSPIAIDENVIRLKMRAGPKLGHPALISLDSEEHRIVNRTRTVGRERKGKGTVVVRPGTDPGELVAEGEYPRGEPGYSMKTSVPDPVRHAARRLAQRLRRAGVAIGGGVRFDPLPRDLPLVRLAAVSSPPMSDLVKVVLEISHNWYADMLLRVFGRAMTGVGRVDAGLAAEAKFLRETVGLAKESFVLEDASGLSQSDLITPAALVGLLEWVWEQPWRGDYLEAMATHREGTLAGWPNLPPATFAKTGRIRQTVALAGFLILPKGPPIAFAALVNHEPGSARGVRRELRDRLRKWRARVVENN